MRLKKKMKITNVIYACIMLTVIVLLGWNNSEIHKEIKRNSAPVLEQEVWGAVKSEDINDRGISLYRDDKLLDVQLYMDEKFQILIAADDAQDCFQCFAGFYDDMVWKLQKKDTVLQFPIGEYCYYVNDTKVEDQRYAVEKNGEMFLPFDVLAEQFLCTYTWDARKNQIQIQNNWTDSITPGQYNLQVSARATIIKNQGTLGTCWAVAALSALETTLRPEESLLFATDHMSVRNSFYMSQNDGGEYTMSMAYLLGWQGPVLESDDPYGDEISPVDLSAVKHVQEVQIIKEKNIDKIKEAVFLHGAVQSSIYTSMRSQKSRSSYYNKEEAAYCYNGDEQQNHEIIIIGWDDAYPKENFNVEVEGNGAFICQNSWGTEFGKEGIFYVSYYDTHIGSQSVVYTQVESADNYDSIYQTDLCGWAGQLGYNSDTAYFSNAFTADSEETVEAAGFYATGKNTSYEVYFVPDFQNEDSLDKRVRVAVGKVDEAGFYTIPFEEEKIVGEGQKFAIIVKITTPDSIHPVAVEYAADETTKNVDLSDGEGYISMYGEEWSNVETEQNCNVCMKIYTNEVVK